MGLERAVTMRQLQYEIITKDIAAKTVERNDAVLVPAILAIDQPSITASQNESSLNGEARVVIQQRKPKLPGVETCTCGTGQ